MFNSSGNRIVRIVLAFLILSAAPAFGLTMHDLTTETVTFEWTNTDTRTQWFEVRLRWLDITTAPALVTEITKIDKGIFTATLKKPRLGRWAVEVRACTLVKYSCTADGKLTEEFSDTGTLTSCSVWQESDVVGAPAPWAVNWRPKPVTGIDINDYIP